MTVATVVRKLIEGKKGKFFKVTFKRKTNKYATVDGVRTLVAKKGDLRTMLCRRGVGSFTNASLGFAGKAKDTVSEDSRNDVMTVFDVELYNQYRKDGLRPVSAGRRAYRRINLADVTDISTNVKELVAVLD